MNLVCFSFAGAARQVNIVYPKSIETLTSTTFGGMSRYRFITFFAASVWIINGFVCKLLNFVPRHQEIVGRILGDGHAEILTKSIGFLEICMGIWILSGFSRRLNVFMQIFIVLTMNALEYILVPDLLLWGRLNIVFAILFCLLIFCNEFYLRKPVAQQT